MPDPLRNLEEHRMDRRQQSRVFVDLPVHIWGGVENLSVETRLWDIDPLRCAAAVGQG
jgi:hypothetical protein